MGGLGGNVVLQTGSSHLTRHGKTHSLRTQAGRGPVEGDCTGPESQEWAGLGGLIHTHTPLASLHSRLS